MVHWRDQNRSYAGKGRTGTTAVIVVGLVLVVVVTACLIIFRGDIGPSAPQSTPTGPFRGSQ